MVINPPGGFIGYSEHSLELFGGSSRLGLDDQVKGKEPEVKGGGSLLKNSPNERVNVPAARASIGGASTDWVKVGLLSAFWAVGTGWKA